MSWKPTHWVLTAPPKGVCASIDKGILGSYWWHVSRPGTWVSAHGHADTLDEAKREAGLAVMAMEVAEEGTI